MSTKIKFCRVCQKKTEHDCYTDLLGDGGRSHFAERLFLVVITVGASEVMADKRFECMECGRRTRA